MASSWDWIGEYADRAAQTDDEGALRLCQFCLWAEAVPNSQPAAKLAFYEQGRDLARQMNEPWWQMFYEHWVIETLLHKQSRPHDALKLAARAALEIRKPVYDAFPQRPALQLNLISCYLAIDPIGYETQLREAFEPLAEECARWSEFRCYHAQQWGHFLSNIEDAEALEAAWHYLDLAQGTQEEWDLKCALMLLCMVLWKFDRAAARESLGELAAAAEALARDGGEWDDVASSVMWRALAARWSGDEAEAATLYARAWQAQKRAPPPRNDVHFAAMAFHRAANETERELEVCQREIEIVAANGLTFLEVKRRVRACELGRELGQPIEGEIALAREKAAQLKSRAFWEEKLDALTE